MATFSAIAATSNAILGLLESAAPSAPDLASTNFSLYDSADLQRPMGDRLEVSLYLYRIAVNTSRRNPSPRVDAFGRRLKSAIPLDLYYMLTAWSKDAAMQQRLLGWCIRVIQDTPTIPAGVLNQHSSEQVFRPDETVEVIWENISRQDLFDIWEVARANQQPSASYVARIVELESTVAIDEHPIVQATEFGFGKVTAS